MSEAWGHLVGVFTVAILLVFIAIWLWAWSPYHKRDFDRLARLPMDDDNNESAASEEKVQP